MASGMAEGWLILCLVTAEWQLSLKISGGHGDTGNRYEQGI